MMESNMVTIPCDKLKEMQSETATLTAKLAESEKQLAEAMKDAERYRSECENLRFAAMHIFGLGAHEPQGETRDVIEWFDASIRAARSAE